jgi:hypothetical protein
MRSGLMIAAGTALMLAPFAAGLSVAAVVTGIGVGSLAVALGVAGTGDGGRGTLPISAQAAYDRGLALGLMAVAILFGAAGQPAALAVFAVAGLATLVVATATRYTVTRA